MDDGVHEELLERAERLGTSASQLVNRYVKEGLRMDEHPTISFVTTTSGRYAVLALRPRLKVIDIIGTWLGERQDITATARYFDLPEEEIRAILRYYAQYKDELDQALRRHLEAQENYKRVLQRREARARRRVAKAGR